MRLNQYLAHHAGVSRRKADQLIQAGAIKVNGQVAVLGQKINPDQDTVNIKWQTLSASPQDKRYFVVNKPKGYVTTTQDELGRPTVLDLIPRSDLRLYPIGRLDIDSEGLLILTNDGDLTYQLTHPKHHVTKVYEVLIEGRPSQEILHKFRTGVHIRGGITAPAKVTILKHPGKNTLVEITITEGKNRQIRRMVRVFGHQILSLKRVAIGHLSLEDLQGKSYLEFEPTALTNKIFAVDPVPA